MSTALAVVPSNGVPSVTSDQMDLIRRTIAKDATPEELQLFLYDNARRGVHPLDRLIHFTKRGGKYTPITSIDFMRARAHETGACAGITDAVFEAGPVGGPPMAATVTVFRLVAGQSCAFTATARWSEYKPEQNDFMWKRMPHTMLGKCAEALALRKAFPQQLQGLYAKEEMDQAGSEATLIVTPHAAVDGTTGEVIDAAPPPPTDDLLRIVQVSSAPTRNKNVTKYTIQFSDGRSATTIKEKLAKLCEQLCQEQAPLDEPECEETKYGLNLVAVHRLGPPLDDAEHAPAFPADDEFVL